MGSPSKEERVVELFFNEPSKHWHFHDIVATAKVSEAAASKWLKRLLRENIIVHEKPDGRMPYFRGNFRHNNYRNRKKLYAMNKLYESGLLARLQGLDDARAIVIFGSFSRSDWNMQSDVDIFILGDPGDLERGTLWANLGFQGQAREIQVHSFASSEEVRKIRSGLMKNVVMGLFIKGSIHDIAQVEV